MKKELRVNSIMAWKTKGVACKMTCVFFGTILCAFALYHSVEPSMINGYISSYTFKYVMPTVSVISLITVTALMKMFSRQYSNRRFSGNSIRIKISFFALFGVGNVLRNLILLTLEINCGSTFTSGKIILNSLVYFVRICVFVFEMIIVLFSINTKYIGRYVRIRKLLWYFILIDTLDYCLNSSLRDLFAMEAFENDNLPQNHTLPSRFPILGCKESNYFLVSLWRKTLPFILPMGMEYLILFTTLILYHFGEDEQEITNSNEAMSNIHVTEQTISYKRNGLPKYSLITSLIVNVAEIAVVMVSNYVYKVGTKGLIVYDIEKVTIAVGAGFTFLATVAGFCVISKLKTKATNSFRNDKDITAYIYLITIVGETTFSSLGIISSLSKAEGIDVYALMKNIGLFMASYSQTILILFAFSKDFKRATQRETQLVQSALIFIGLYNLKGWFIASSFGLRVTNLRKGHQNEGPVDLIGYSGWLILKDIMSPLAMFYRLHSFILCYSLYNTFTISNARPNDLSERNSH